MRHSPRLVGLITTSPKPELLADFYRFNFGIPYQLSQHGTMPPHYECDVAASVGINPATLHHYFLTKEDLILGVGEHLEAGYIQARTADRPSSPTPLSALRSELADAAFFRTQRPRWVAVSREFATRAP